MRKDDDTELGKAPRKPLIQTPTPMSKPWGPLTPEPPPEPAPDPRKLAMERDARARAERALPPREDHKPKPPKPFVIERRKRRVK